MVECTQPQKRSRTAAKCTKMRKARAKRAKLLFFICKYANLCSSFFCLTPHANFFDRKFDLEILPDIIPKIRGRIFYSSNSLCAHDARIPQIFIINN